MLIWSFKNCKSQNFSPERQPAFAKVFQAAQENAQEAAHEGV